MREIFLALTFVAAILYADTARAQLHQVQLSQAPQPDMLEHWRKSTVSIGQRLKIDNKDTHKTIGSGVIIGISPTSGCILTAKHNAFNPGAGYLPTITYIRIPQDTPSQEMDLGVPVSLGEAGNNTWRSLDSSGDLAVFPLPDLRKYKDPRGVQVNNFANEDDIFQGANIMVMGYPSLLGEEYLSTPLARAGIISWTDPVSPASKPFVVDANLFPGNSGGPVFRIKNGFDRSGNLVLAGGISFAGIVSKGPTQTVPVTIGAEPLIGKDSASGKIERAQVKILAIGGAGIIEPVVRVRELIEKHCSQ